MQDYYIREADDSDDDDAADSSSDNDEPDDEDGCPPGNYLSFDDEMELERKSRLSLFPASGDAGKSGDKPAVKSDDPNEDLFYDPEADDEDEEWIKRKRNQYLLTGESETNSAGKLSQNRIKKTNSTTDAVLNCPACMTLLCLDCQRHEVYKSQYRAMFVQSCTTDFTQELHVPDGSKGRKWAAKKKQRGGGTEEHGTDDPETVNSKYYSVKCDVCRTQVAVYDQDEVYHFFNVLSSHS